MDHCPLTEHRISIHLRMTVVDFETKGAALWRERRTGPPSLDQAGFRTSSFNRYADYTSNRIAPPVVLD